MMVMSITSLTIAVDSEAAQAFAAISPEHRRKIELLLNLRLRELTIDSKKPLQQTMDEIGASAQQSGLTPEMLTELLNGK
jgi:hypothetical protein